MFTGTLLPYQEDPVDRMVARGNMLVAFEMGLGKTPMTIAVIEELMGDDKVECTVVVAQAGLKYQWAEEIATFTDVEATTIKVGDEEMTIPTDEYCVVIDGTPEQRLKQYQRVLAERPDYVIMAYDNVINDWKHVRRIKPDAIVLDEATAIKTFAAQRSRKIKRLEAPYRYALTGTPIENGKPEEVFSIMQWVDETVLGRWDMFEKAYIVRNHWGGVERYKNLHVFHARLSDAMVRKTRDDPDVKPFLPTVHEKRLWARLDPAARKVYQHITEELQADLRALAQQSTSSFDLASYYGGKQANENSAQGRVMAKMSAMERLLKHPDLLVASALDFEWAEKQRQKGVQRANWPGSAYVHGLYTQGLLEGLEGAPKLDLLVDTLDEILDDAEVNKIIVFAAEPMMLEIIAEQYDDVGYVFYHGEMNAKQKAEAKRRFLRDPDCRIFLTSDAGGYGVNLPVANYLINYDIPWQAGKAKQRNTRHDRASSPFKDIYVYNLLVEHSIEERKYRTVQFKSRVSSAIVDGKGADNKGRIDNDLDSLSQFLDENAA